MLLAVSLTLLASTSSVVAQQVRAGSFNLVLRTAH